MYFFYLICNATYFFRSNATYFYLQNIMEMEKDLNTMEKKKWNHPFTISLMASP